MNFLHIKETCIYVTDLERTEAFYHEKLGLKVIGRVEGRHVFFRAGSSVLLCFIAQHTSDKSSKLPVHGAKGCVHFAFEIKPGEYQKTKHEIIDAGIMIEHEQNWREDLCSFYFRDPDGNLIEIAQKGIWDV